MQSISAIDRSSQLHGEGEGWQLCNVWQLQICNLLTVGIPRLHRLELLGTSPLWALNLFQKA
jgi:hypothetical protein